MRLIARLTIILACLAMVSYAAAATYYVSPAGNDAAPGTSAQPWRTIQKAAGIVAAGDTVIVRAGTYGGRVMISRSGTASAPIRFTAEGNVNTAGFSVRASYVHVAGFQITAVAARYSVDGAGVQIAGTGCRVENNVISRCGYFGVHVDVGSRQVVVKGNLIDQCALAGINAHGTGHLIEDNEIRDIRVSMAGNTYGDADGLYLFDSGHTVRRNYIHSISLSANAGYTPHIDCVHSWTANKYVAMSDCVFEQNVFDLQETTSANHTAGFMIEGNPRNIMIRNNVFRAGRVIHFVTGTNIRVLNNTIVGRLSWPTARNPAGIYLERTSSSVVRNNLIMDFPWNAVYISGNSGLTIGNNCTWNSNGTRPGGTAQSGDLWGINPGVASLSGFDFHLLVDSPCRDAGVALSDVTNDFDGRARPYGPRHDIGAFEYGAGGGGTTNRPPAAGFTATPQTGQAPLAVAFDGRFSGDTDGTLVSFVWSYGDGASANGAVVSHTYASPGTYTARLTVTDNGGLSASATKTITVTSASAVNRPPAAGFTATPQTGQAPLAVAFDGRFSGDTDGTLVTFAWNYGDGATAIGAIVSHTYASAGSYIARLTVTDNGGLSASTTRTITVTAASGGGGGGGTGPFYVDAGLGNDGNPGTSALPWRTIQKAAASVAAGADVTIRQGTYDERVLITRSGTADAPIRFTANGTVRTRGFSVRADYIHLKGFTCASSGAAGSEDAAGIFVRGTGCRIDTNMLHQTAYAGILLDPASRFCTVAGNVCSQAALAGIVLQGEGHLAIYNRVFDTRCTVGGNAYGDADGIQAAGSRHVVRGNLVHRITLEANAGASPSIEGIRLRGGATDCVVEQNFIDLPIATAATHATGVMIEANPRNIIVRNNIVRAGRGIHVLTGTSVRVLNNTLIGWLSWPTAHNPAGIYVEQTVSSTVRNNIVCDYPWNAIYEAGNTGLSIGTNCAWNTDGTRPGGAAQSGDLWGMNPGFVAYYIDFRLLPSSPCLDRCAPSADVPGDFDGRARPYGAGIDMGAYEYRPASVAAAGAAQIQPAFPFPTEFGPVRSIRTSDVEPPTRSIRDRTDKD